MLHTGPLTSTVSAHRLYGGNLEMMSSIEKCHHVSMLALYVSVKTEVFVRIHCADQFRLY